ncbi:carboxylesterase family protein [Aspergillus heteromorphus CBS 117.55]|uniref:Carboxylic ester hydrolase n=1 Tax=Aspergillus heteromorphus CBS 117.55 TaxID=1448321 RepID=A0A317UU40_9EURO|nr:carboxylesterase family protein [Aspergillus heteromorphus CBS 117.55]PWY64057.1 carboxylesterase family protein [Aspergillus heteromorphus CBS 117.55]
MAIPGVSGLAVALTRTLTLALATLGAALPGSSAAAAAAASSFSSSVHVTLHTTPSSSASASAYPFIPTVTLHPQSRPQSANKTIIIGRSLPEFNQDLFLGIKFANEPVRFTPSVLKSTYTAEDSNSGPYDPSALGVSSTSTSDTILYNATEYGYDCPGYGSDDDELEELGWVKYSEDCLNLNVVRPQGEQGTLLPVMVWIFGGGWMEGATADPRYNMSYILRQGAVNGKPVIGVSINYRVAMFGFLDSEEVMASGNTNLGLRDQRVAMHWVKQNIAAFGGDPEKITIWGESAGAYSVGAHLVTNDGDDEGLFRAAIMESGNAVGPPWNGTDWYQPMYDELVNKTNCTTSLDTLQCLRDVPFPTFYNLAYNGLEWFGTIDGTFIKEFPQISITEGRFAKVPILHGTNTDEGVSFGTTGTDTDAGCIEQLMASKRWVLTETEATTILSLYPNISALGCPYGWGNTTWPSKGYEYKRYESIAGDLAMYAPRRLLGTHMAQYEPNVYAYRWDVAALNDSSTIGVEHFAEIPFVFANPVQNITALGSDPARLELGDLAARMWTAFATDLDPNGHGVSNIPTWPTYNPSDPQDFVFQLPRTDSYVEADTYRAEGMAYINSIAR